MIEIHHFVGPIEFVMYSTLLICILMLSAVSNALDWKHFRSHRSKRAELCPDRTMCRSQWGYCGTGSAYCGAGCQAGPCSATSSSSSSSRTTPTPSTTTTTSSSNSGVNLINAQNFACVFNTLDNRTRTDRLNGLKQSGWNPVNKDEAAVFLAHVFHETDGLRTLREYCAPGCGANYAGSWCDIQGKPGQLYYGRGWFQLSWPCNYYAAGQALNVDLLSNPDLVEQRADLAVQTALWFFKANGIDILAQNGDFAATTQKINGALECNGGPGAASQVQRVAIYRRVRLCFGLGAPTKNPSC